MENELKQKQIEEMAKDFCKNVSTKMCADGTCPNTWDCPFNYKTVEAFYNAGYRKIPENAVVLTREEHEKLQALKDDYVKGYEAGVDEGWDNARKETAEKFAEMVKMAFYYEFDELIPSIMADKIDEICKEITEEQKERLNKFLMKL